LCFTIETFIGKIYFLKFSQNTHGLVRREDTGFAWQYRDKGCSPSHYTNVLQCIAKVTNTQSQSPVVQLALINNVGIMHYFNVGNIMILADICINKSFLLQISCTFTLTILVHNSVVKTFISFYEHQSLSFQSNTIT
jgi:hypothetical protein